MLGVGAGRSRVVGSTRGEEPLLAKSSRRAETELDRLYGLPLEQFTLARNEAAKGLRAGGDDAAARQVGKARKPTTAAWAVNQLARHHEKDVGALLDAGRRLRAAGTDRKRVRAATDAERAAVDRLVTAARSMLARPTETVLEQVRETLHAAALEDSTRELVERGRLTTQTRAVGLGGLAAAPSRATAGQRRPDEAAVRKAQQRLAKAGRAVERARTAQRRSARGVVDAEAELERRKAAEVKAANQLRTVADELRDAVGEAADAGMNEAAIARSSGLGSKDVKALRRQLN